MEPKVIDLYEFLVESELQHYYNCIKNELKITTVAHLKYATDEDFKQIGLSRPEIRRMRKFYEKYFPHGYLSKIKRLLQNPTKKDELITTQTNPILAESTSKTSSSPTRIPNNKHIIPADSICVNKQLGIGEFGIVQQGVWTNGTERIQVAIKCLCRERMISNPMDFLKEAAIMHSIEHENIVRLYGVVLDTDSLMLVTELAPLRSLLECLKDSSLRVNFLTVPTLCEFAMQICNGMMYLEAKRLIHRDLAARNILVFSKNKVKISDFGLSRALGAGKDYYTIKFSPALKLPMAWCAPECISFLRFTSASDVWAYGVCLWEMFSYGFQPWAALTGLQILEAIDSPSCQRLEQPDCCPKEYYMLMLKCWAHIPEKRPKFSEIYTILPDIKPEQLKTIVAWGEIKKDHLMYRQGEIITVLDKANNSPLWKGVLNSGKTGLFNPANSVAYLEGLPSSNNRDSFSRTLDRCSKRKLRTEMISKPQNDLKHTGHVGLDGAYFGDVSFLSNTSNIVTPYKPSEDLEQTPLLLPPTPTSPDSTQTASGYFSESTNPSFVHSIESTLNTTMSTTVGDITPKHHQNDGFGSCFNFNNIPSPTLNYPGSNPFINHDDNSNAFNASDQFKSFVDELEEAHKEHQLDTSKWPINVNDQHSEGSHEYHEISDDEVQAEKIFDGPSLLDEMDYMFRSMSTTSNHAPVNQLPPQQQQPPQSPDFDHTNHRNEITELASKLQRKNSSDTSYNSGTNKSNKKLHKNGSSIKQISHKDEKILNHAIEIANEISARSMTDLFSSETAAAHSLQSPKRKFSFKFPHLGGVTGGSSSSGGDKDSNGSTIGSGANSNSNTLTNSKERKNFSEELKNVSDLQNIITEEHRLAYNSLVDKRSSGTFDEVKMATLPASNRSSTACNKWREKLNGIEFTLPRDKAPRPTTLPYNRSTSLTNQAMRRQLSPQDNCDLNPLRKLRDKNFSLIRPRLKTLPLVQTNNIPNDFDQNCHSPNYLTNSDYSFSSSHRNSMNDKGPEDVNLQSSQELHCKNTENKQIHDSLNPIPLPPRDKNKIKLTNYKRHVRKHPLIIPGTGVQRTLNKVTQDSPTDENSFGVQKSLVSNNNYNNHAIKQVDHQSSSKLKDFDVCLNTSNDLMEGYANQFIENNFPKAENYQNKLSIESINDLMHDNMDSASLHFESILENDINHHDIVDGCGPSLRNHILNNGNEELDDDDDCFEAQKDFISKRCGDDDSRNLDVIEKKKIEFSQKHPKYVQPKNELASNALFNKIKSTVELAVTTNGDRRSGMRDRSRSEDDGDDDDDDAFLNENCMSTANVVSCEDLLEFADDRPNGKERGVDSDEVRIMSKVLGNLAVPEQCLSALDTINWDVHKAIKIYKLYNIINTSSLTMEECCDALKLYDWDLQATVLKLKETF